MGGRQPDSNQFTINKFRVLRKHMYTVGIRETGEYLKRHRMTADLDNMAEFGLSSSEAISHMLPYERDYIFHVALSLLEVENTCQGSEPEQLTEVCRKAVELTLDQLGEDCHDDMTEDYIIDTFMKSRDGTLERWLKHHESTNPNKCFSDSGQRSL